MNAAESTFARDETDSPRMQAFLRGLSIGALVGAAIAGSAIWERSQRKHRPVSSVDSAEEPGAPAEPTSAEPTSADATSADATSAEPISAESMPHS